MMTNTLKQHLQNLHLSGLLSSLELRLQEAGANRLPHAQFLELLLQDEINVRHQRRLARRHKSADFRESRSLENFDFSFNPSIKRAQIYELAAGHFVRQHRESVAAPGDRDDLGVMISRRISPLFAGRIFSRTDKAQEKQNSGSSHGNNRLVPAKRARHDANKRQYPDQRGEQRLPKFWYRKILKHSGSAALGRVDGLVDVELR